MHATSRYCGCAMLLVLADERTHGYARCMREKRQSGSNDASSSLALTVTCSLGLVDNTVITRFVIGKQVSRARTNGYETSETTNV
eukprot:scaffold668154_cov57-Prasinocladus_malaysianus.AAC.1